MPQLHCSDAPPLACLPPCPVDGLRAELSASLARGGNLALTAPPGAGKSSRVPLWLLAEPWSAGRKILLLEPRRVAARALARYMARLLGEEAGQTVGFRMRRESAISAATRIEVITEGVLTRMLQDDPELPRAACVIFDEFHERSLVADTGLALCLESQAALRPDLRLLVMSATLDMQSVSGLLGRCPVLSCQGRSFPVEMRYFPVPGRAARGAHAASGIWRHAAEVAAHLLRTEHGSLLVFLPGEGEIRQMAALLEGRLPPDVLLCPLYGNLPPERQDAAIAPAPPGLRKAVLATAIAETSLTIEGVRLVLDAGLTRVARFDPASRLSRLVTERVSLAGAAQRAGRAGRTQPGICCRLWDRKEENGMRPQIRPEILDADLSNLALQLAVWGVSDAAALPWPDPPPAAHLAAARQNLQELGALDSRNRPTALGRSMASLPLPPHLGRLLLLGREDGHGALACCVAALLEERDPLLRFKDTAANGLPNEAEAAANPGRALAPRGTGACDPGCDLLRRLDWLCREGHGGAWRRLRDWAARLAQLTGIKGDLFNIAAADAEALGRLLALAWPDRVAKRLPESKDAPGRDLGTAHFLLRSGRAAWLPGGDALARRQFLAIADLDGAGARARIRLAAPLTREDVEELFHAQIRSHDQLTVNDEGSVSARRQKTLGALVLEDAPLPRPPAGACAAAICAFLRQAGPQALARLPWSDAARQWQARVMLLRELEGEPWPDVSDAALCNSLESWLAPYLTDCASLGRFSAARLQEALRAQLPPQLARRLEKQAPCRWQAPSGAQHPIVYGEEGGPWLAARLQELFGCEDAPRIADGRVALTLRLNSPAGRTLQVTRDLAHFWRHGYPAVRAEMRGRYPRHPWPEDPLSAPATALTKKKLAARGKA